MVVLPALVSTAGAACEVGRPTAGEALHAGAHHVGAVLVSAEGGQPGQQAVTGAPAPSHADQRGPQTRRPEGRWGG